MGNLNSLITNTNIIYMVTKIKATNKSLAVHSRFSSPKHKANALKTATAASVSLAEITGNNILNSQ